MSHPHLKLTYALKNGEIVHISAVEKGLACGCVCPACGETLVAKKGDKMMHHFAHSSGSTCEYGYESSLHLAAKDILSKAEKMVIPAVYLEFLNPYKERQLISAAKEISIDAVELEKYTEGIIPDIVVHSGGKKFFVEIYVTHKIDSAKLEKIKSLDVSTIEIDLRKLDYSVPIDELSDILLSDSSKKIWKYNRVAQKWLDCYYQVSEKIDIIEKDHYDYVDYCPIRRRIRKGNLTFECYNCFECKYLIFTHFNDEGFLTWILCSGRSRIAEIKDF